MDWRRYLALHPSLFRVLVTAKRLRTKVGLVLVVYCVVEGLLFNEVPLDLLRLDANVVIGLALVVAGVAFRIAAHGSLAKKETLATQGIYSVCRHPLYLGSILLTYGFCLLLDDAENFVIAAVYFAVFYTLTIVWEEVRLADRYDEVHRRYCRATPLLLPLGRFRSGDFAWKRALAVEGLTLLGVTIALLVAFEAMARFMPAHA